MVTLSQVREQQVFEIPCDDGSADSAHAARAAANRQAFSSLYLQYADRVFRHCYRRLGTREAAEDATSQVFTQALAAIERFDPNRGSFASWIFAIAHNVLVDHHRIERRYLSGLTFDERADMAETPEEAVLAGERASGLRHALRELPPREREVIELRLAGLTAGEIADVTGCGKNAVAQAQFRAVGRLRVLLGAQQPDQDNANV